MPRPTKRQKKDSAGSGALQEENSRFLGSRHGDVVGGFLGRKDTAADAVMKDERHELSQSAKSRHRKNEVRDRLRKLIPGPGKVSDNGLMLQAASRIKELEIQIDSAANQLERLRQLHNSSDSSNKNSKDHSVTAVVPAVQEAKDGAEALRAVLLQPTKAKGTRLLESALQYMTELVQERDQLVQQIEEHQGSAEAQELTPDDIGK